MAHMVTEAEPLTRQSDEGLALHPTGQQSVQDWRPVLLLEPGEQRHQLGHWCLCTQVLYTQHLQWDKTNKQILNKYQEMLGGDGHVTKYV